MYSPVFLSCPTTSGSPPVLSISLSDHSFSALTSSFACTLAHSRPLWRFMFFSKRAFNALSSSSRCSGDKSFLLLLMFRALVALIVASGVSYLLLRCALPRGDSFCLSLRSYQFAFSTSDQFRAGPSSPCDSVSFTAHCKLLISPPNGVLARHTVQGWAAIGAETVPMRSLR